MPSPRRLALPILALSAALTLAGCAAGSDDPGAGGVRVVASTNVYGQIVEQIGGDRVSVTSIIGTGAQDPHSYEATARDQLAVQRAQLIVENGGGYDPFIDSLVAAAGGDPLMITAVEFAPGWPGESADHDDDVDHDDAHADDAHDDSDHDDSDHADHDDSDHADHDDSDHADDDHDGHGHVEGFNEHVWFDPATMILLSEQIAADLTELDPAGAAEFTANAATLVAELEGVQTQLATIATEHAGEGVFLTEPLAGYLIDAAELVDVAPAGFSEAVEAGRDVSPSTLLASIRVIESGAARAVLLNGQTGGAETKRIMDAAANAGIPVVPFTETLPETLTDTAADNASGAGTPTTYAEWMSDNVERLAAALGA